MKRTIVFPVFVESSTLLVVFLLLINLVSLAGNSITAQNASLEPQLSHSPGIGVVVPEKMVK